MVGTDEPAEFGDESAAGVGGTDTAGAVSDGGEFAGDDPRVRADHVRTVAGGEGDARVVLVGVVHDHPASVHRSRSVVASVQPDVLALELPQVALPLFEQRADATTGSRETGGEMASAIEAARAGGTDRVVGIDVPSRAFVQELAGLLATSRPSLETAAGVVAGALSVTGDAIRCRLAAVAGGTPAVASPAGPSGHDCGAAADPAVQAAHESRHLSRSRSLLGALEAPASVRLTDAARERAMARRIDDLRRTGSVVGVVGFDHLDAVAAGVAAAAAPDGATDRRE